jgi:hypothetical protein
MECLSILDSYITTRQEYVHTELGENYPKTEGIIERQNTEWELLIRYINV